MPPKQPGKRKKPPKVTLNVFVDSGPGLAPQTLELEVSPDLDFKQLPGKFRSALTEKGWRIQSTWTFAYFSHEITREEVITRLLDPPDGFKVINFHAQSWSQLMKDLLNLDANVLHVYAYDGTAERKINVFNIHTRVIAEMSSAYESTVRTGYRIVPPELRYIVGTPECDDYIQRLSKEDAEGYKIVGLFRALATIFPLHPPGVLHFIDLIPPPPPKASVTKGGMEPHPDPPANEVIDERTLPRSRQIFFTTHPSKSPWSDGGETNLGPTFNSSQMGCKEFFDNPCPPSLYDETLCQLHYDAFHAVPTEQDMVNLFALRKAMIKVYETNAKGDADRGQAFANAMGPVLGEILSERNIRGTQYTIDGCTTWTIDQQSYSAHFAVYRAEYAGCTTDPFVQAMHYVVEDMRRLFDGDYSKYQHFAFPVIIMCVVGPHMFVMVGTAGGLKGHPSIEHIASINFLMNPNNHPEMQAATRVLAALRRGSENMKIRYPSLLSDTVHQCLYPFPCSYPDLKTSITKRFTYSSNVPDKRVYFAKSSTDPPEDICVKFASTYVQQAHIQAAKVGLAPELLGYEQHGWWHMVVTQDLSSRYIPLDDAQREHASLFDEDAKSKLYEELLTKLTLFHKAGYVHGDIRSVNILVSRRYLGIFPFTPASSSSPDLGPTNDPRVLLIDYDWAGPEGPTTTYPLNISHRFFRPDDAIGGQPILAAHDIAMLRRAMRIPN